MPKRFEAYSISDFIERVRKYNWRAGGKTEVHVHHTWRPNHSQYRGEASIRGMWLYHTQNNGWSDIAQHVSIAPDGTIWSGRDWNQTPVSAVGHNHAGVFMFETIGDFDVGKDVLKGDQLEAVLMVTAAIQDHFNLALWTSIRFHNQMSGKTCPGSAVNRSAFIGQVKDARDRLSDYEVRPVAELIATADATAAPQPSLPPQVAEDADEATHDESLAGYWNRTSAFDDALAAGLSESLHGDSTAPAWAGALGEAAFLVQQARFIDGQEASERQLLTELARQTSADMDATQDEGPVGDFFVRTGNRILMRLERQLHAVVCGDAEDDQSDRQAILSALKIGEDVATAAVTAFLISGIGIAPAIAGIAGALILKRLIRPAMEEAGKSVCEVWSERLNNLV